MPLASLFDAISSKKGATLLAPAILLFGATLAIGQNAADAPAAGQPPAASAAPAAGAAPAAADKAAATADKVAAAPTGPSAFSTTQRQELDAIIKNFLLSNPEVLLEAQNLLEAKMEKIQSDRMAVAINENVQELFRTKASPIVGNAKGDVTVVEFFDYNCGYCKRAFTELAKLVDKDKQVKVVLKEFPILSKGSEEAAKVALAAKMQGKYWEFHRGMLEGQGQVGEAAALKVAEKLGLDMTRIKRDMASAEVKKEIDDTRKLAGKLGIQGTPHFLVGERVIPGAPENLLELLDKNVAELRKTGCKVC
jgi:protein-disulfide isomerase